MLEERCASKFSVIAEEVAKVNFNMAIVRINRSQIVFVFEKNATRNRGLGDLEAEIKTDISRVFHPEESISP
jgi:hypothetical protein